MSYPMTILSQIANQSWNALPSSVTSFITHKMTFAFILLEEAFTTLTSVLPAAFKWVFRKYVYNEIQTFEIKGTKAIAYLYFHGLTFIAEKNEKVFPLLFCHGDHSHPLTLLHLADLAKLEKRAVFSLYIPNCHKDDFEELDNFLELAIDKIEECLGSNFGGILGVGHSKGAILLANRQFVHEDERIEATCAIAGRLNVCQETKGLPVKFETFIKKISKSILDHPTKKLVQIIPERDWNASYNSMAIRPEKQCYVVDGMHLSGMYATGTSICVNSLIKENV